jgi:hypothetical protein
MSIADRFRQHPILATLVGVMAFRVVLGLLFSLLLLSQPTGEGHMLILLDLPALAMFGLSQFAFGVPEGLADAFDPAYWICSFLGWLVVGLVAGAACARLRRSPLTLEP